MILTFFKGYLLQGIRIMGKSQFMRSPILYLVPFVLFMAACGNSSLHTRPTSETEAVDSKPATDGYLASADSTAYSSNLLDIRSASRKRVRTADIRCGVKDVAAVTFAIETAVAKVGGITKQSTIHNISVSSKDLPFTADSLKRVTLYTPVSNMEVRVPVASLDTVVNLLTAMASFIDHRTLKEEDRTLTYLTNALKNEAQARRGAVTPRAKDSTLDVERYNDSKESEAIDRRMNNLAILDDVNYSTFTIELFQPEVAKVYTVVNPDQQQRAAFGSELLSAFRSGASALRNTFIFLIQIWPFLVIAGLGWFVYRKNFRA